MTVADFTSYMMVAGSSLFASRAGLFLRVLFATLVFIAVATAARRLLAPHGRAWTQVATALVLVAVLATPLFALVVAVYFVAFYALVERLPRGLLRNGAILAAIAVQIVVPIWWLPPPPATPILVRELIAFTTNMTQCRCWSYAWDRSHEDAPAPSLRDYLHYMTFLPSFVGGPLLAYREFQAGRLASYWEDRPVQLGDIESFRRTWVRLGLGLAAAVATLPFVPVLTPNAYTAAMAGPLHAWGHAIAVYLAVYLGFSAWSETAIGSGRLAGIVLPENFDRAHFSYGVADFWRRWNIRLGWWMREYVYLPLGGGRRKVARNLAAVFLATAVYHHIGGFKLIGPGMMLWPSFYVGWLGWAALNMVGTLATRHWRAPATFGPRDVAIVVGTVLFSCVALQTAFFPAGLPAARLLDVYKALVMPVRP